eukprot:TRINITY_DN4953_c0_g1_i1.p1 TRINITY_DN4953_c0_g1~~TRINITY_DN4953_c0_g1_i1.p1  ORF type:complete len:1080 (+),score=290.07 TRINITY_DN4953_c0_g1_i1:115-3354(+)
MRKKVDSRVRTLIENGVALGHRSLFVIVGDKGREQVVNLHYMLSKSRVKTRPNVLWCYKNELGFSSHKQKRMRQIKRDVQRGLKDPDADDPFELFISSTDIRYTYYKDTHKILGATYGMCILQDFEALTPNLLARTIETVEGGGVIILLLQTMSSLRQLYSMTMDVHQRYRTAAHDDVQGRFNERFLLSLAPCKQSLIVDDELNVLALSSAAMSIKPVKRHENQAGGAYQSANDIELTNLKESLKDTPPIGELIQVAKTLDQAKALLGFAEATSEKTLRSTITLTAARGRGKSAALGLAIASAIAYGYANIFVTAPSPENLGTVFDFVFKGFDALEYQEHLDYELLRSTNPDFNKAVVRVNVFKGHRQTIQYIQPQDYVKLGQAELLVIDEAAAIPLPVVKKLMGPYLIFLSSTINGYEGTGRSLSLKLIKELRTQRAGALGGGLTEQQPDLPTPGRGSKPGAGKKDTAPAPAPTGHAATGAARGLTEIVLNDPIRYNPGDGIETWLNGLLCLDAQDYVRRLPKGAPHPDECELYYVNRDTLFSFHKASEIFLQRMMALYVSSHYKNTPNDLQLMSDAPAHHLFVLIAPVDESSNGLPDILAVVQVALEGAISRKHIMAELGRGKRAAGDLIPWGMSEQYQDSDFASLSGARVVRIAVHPEYQSMGYGSRALEMIERYYNQEIPNLGEDDNGGVRGSSNVATVQDIDLDLPLAQQQLKPRQNLPPLLCKLSERKAESLQWLGTSFGLTQRLGKFWSRHGYTPVYIRSNANDITGEHSSIYLKALSRGEGEDFTVDSSWLHAFSRDFRSRFLTLLSYHFRHFNGALVLDILRSINDSAKKDKRAQDDVHYDRTDLDRDFSPYDLKRIESYANNLVDHHLILDLVPTIAERYYTGKVTFNLSVVQSVMLLSIGLQRKTIDQVRGELGLPSNQILALFNKIMRKASDVIKKIQVKDVEQSMPELRASKEQGSKMTPHRKDLEEDLEQAGTQAASEFSAKQQELIRSLDVAQYAIDGDDAAWDEALANGKATGVVSVKSKRKKGGDDGGSAKKKSRKDDQPGSGKKGKSKKSKTPKSGKKKHK